MSRLEELFAARLAVIVPDAVGAAHAAEIRARLDRAGWTRYALVDRGCYDVQATPGEGALTAALVHLAAARTGRPLHLISARALRLRPGDYLLARHDRVDEVATVELMLDLSPAAVPGAEVHYRRDGQVYFRVPPAPGTLSIVERGPAVACHHLYVSKRHIGAIVVRLVMVLR